MAAGVGDAIRSGAADPAAATPDAAAARFSFSCAFNSSTVGRLQIGRAHV
jgi:hypothetical protein